MFFLPLQAHGSVTIEGVPWGGCEDRVYFRNEIPKGCNDYFLPYEELTKYSWIETTDAGLFARGGKLGSAPPHIFLPVLRKDRLSDETGRTALRASTTPARSSRRKGAQLPYRLRASAVHF